MHLIIDGFGGDPRKLQSLETIYEVLDYYPQEIGMTKIAPPYVFKYVGAKPKDWGLSGLVLIAESHISIHTFPEREYVNIDIFSCKEFNPEKAIEYLRGKFGLKKMKYYVLNRGLEYSDNIDLSKGTVEAEHVKSYSSVV